MITVTINERDEIMNENHDMSKSVRKSKQRDAILNNLKNRYDHPTAAELFDSVKKDFPALSLGTLYRNLKFLCDSGSIISFSIGDEEHYDANTKQHYHLKCSCCNRFYDLPVSPFDELEHFSLPDYKGKINNYSLIFYGICDVCSSQIC